MAKAMYVFRGNIPATSLVLGGNGTNSTAGDPAAQNVTAGSANPPLVVFGVYGAIGLSGTVNPRTFSTTKDAEIEAVGDGTFSNDVDLWLAYKIYNTAPADTSIDMDDEGTGNFLMSGYIQMIG